MDQQLLETEPNRQLDTYNGYDPTVIALPPSFVTYLFDGNAAEIPIFFLLVVFAVVLMLDRVDGRPLNLPGLFMKRRYQIFPGTTGQRVVSGLLTFTASALLFMPFAALGVWIAALIVFERQWQSIPVVGICAACCGIAFLFFALALFKLRWGFFQFSVTNALLFLLALISLMAYQFVAVLYAAPSLFGYSVVFLFANSLPMILAAFLNTSQKHGSIEDIVMEKLPATDPNGRRPRNPNRDKDFQDEVAEEKADTKQATTQDDIFDLVTIGRPEHRLPGLSNAFSSGFHGSFAYLRPIWKRLLTGFLWAFSAGILVLYSYVVYWNLPGQKNVGFVVMFAVLTTDVLVYLISGLVKTATPLTAALFASRLLLIIFGGANWMYGYLALYLFFGLLLAHLTAVSRFPLEQDDENLDLQIRSSIVKVDLARTPEVLIVLITACYLIVLAILYLVQPSGVPLIVLTIGAQDLPFYLAGILAVLLVVATLSLLCLGRLLLRRQRRLPSRRVTFVKTVGFDAYWLLVILNALCYLVIGLLAAWFSQLWYASAIVIFIDLYLLSLANFHVHFARNDFALFEDVAALNRRGQAHNARLQSMKKDVQKVSQQLLAEDSGNKGAIGVAKAALHHINPKGLDRVREETKKAKELQHDTQWNLSTHDLQQPFTRQQPRGLQPANSMAKIQPMPRGGQTLQKSFDSPMVSPTGKSPNSKASPPIQRQGTTRNQQQDSLRSQDSLKKRQYEGGEAEQMDETAMNNTLKNPQSLRLLGAGQLDGEEQDNEEYKEVDPDEENELDQNQQRVRYRMVANWRQKHWAPTAFLLGKLRANDYQILLSQFLGLGLLALAGWIVCYCTGSYVGITLFVPFAHCGLIYSSQLRSIMTGAPMSFLEHLVFIVAYMGNYGWGAANLYLTYGWRTTSTIQQRQPAAYYLICNVILVPFMTSCISAAGKWIDTKGRFSAFLVTQLILAVIQGGGMIAIAVIFGTWREYTSIAVGLGVPLIVLIEASAFVAHGYRLPLTLVVFNVILTLLGMVAPPLVSFFVSNFATFLGFSASGWLLALILLGYGYSELVADFFGSRPMFFSPWIYPVLAFDPRRKDVVPANLPLLCLYLGYFILIIWAVLATIWLAPTHVGVAFSVLFSSLLVLSLVFVSQLSQSRMSALYHRVDSAILRHAWLEAKEIYIENRNAYSRRELLTFSEIRRRRDIFRNKVRQLEGRRALNLQDIADGVRFMQYLNEQEMLTWLPVDLNDANACREYQSRLEIDLKKHYMLEFELIVMFQLILQHQASVMAEQRKKYLFTFIHERSPLLHSLDIVITVPQNSAFPVQYARVIAQIQNLSPEKQSAFNQLRKQFEDEKIATEERHRAAAEIEEAKRIKREEDAASFQKKRKERMDQNKGKPTEEWVDCWEKYQRVVAECARTGRKFIDAEFRPNEASLGPDRDRFGVETWIRASEIKDRRCFLYKDKISHEDVTQGQLGDCYFLSAMSVLGEGHVKAMLKTVELNPLRSIYEWEKTGCFCVRFFRDGNEEFVLVDDYFPARNNSDGKLEWAFAKGGPLGDQLWPMVLEKAYAKLFGSYSFIEAGKVQYALADMVQGFPEQIDMRSDAKNLDIFWEKLKGLKRQGALMGAGSPENPIGDAAVNQLGIVQGHAYALLDVQEVDQARIVQLRNPHGATGAEWQGDWSDSSSNWTQRARNKLGYNPVDSQDGIFWMDVYDFTQQFSYLYICRLLNDSMWGSTTLEGQWKGRSAEGLPSRTYPNARLDLNPQFEIVITKPCDAYILLKQETDPKSASTFKGKQQIFFMVSKNGGKLIQKVEKETLLMRSGNPINLSLVSGECRFDTSVRYPYKFTLLVANTNHGLEGEGQFQLTVYSTDQKMRVLPLAPQ